MINLSTAIRGTPVLGLSSMTTQTKVVSYIRVVFRSSTGYLHTPYPLPTNRDPNLSRRRVKLVVRTTTFTLPEPSSRRSCQQNRLPPTLTKDRRVRCRGVTGKNQALSLLQSFSFNDRSVTSK